MASQREARSLGRQTGYDIAKQNFADAVDEWVAENGRHPTIADKPDVLEHVVSMAIETESEHYRQFSPFEFTAQAFNQSRDPDAMWAAYDDGVYKGAVQAALDEWSRQRPDQED